MALLIVLPPTHGEETGKEAWSHDRSHQASDPRLAELERALHQRGFAVERVTDMDGWLAYHAAFVACVIAALYRCGSNPASEGSRPSQIRHSFCGPCSGGPAGPDSEGTFVLAVFAVHPYGTAVARRALGTWNGAKEVER